MRLLFGILLICSCFSLLFAEQKEFTIGVEEQEYMPQYKMQNGEFSGVASDILNAFAKSKGYKVKFIQLPVTRLLSAMTSKEVDFKYPDNPYWAADFRKGKTIYYSDPVVDYIDGVLVTPENLNKGVAHIKSLGSIAGFTPFEYLDKIKSGAIKAYSFPNIEGMLIRGINAQIDGVYVQTSVGKYYLNSIKKSGKLVFDPSLPHTKSSYKLSSAKHPEIIAEFNEFLKNKELMKKIKSKYDLE